MYNTWISNNYFIVANRNYLFVEPSPVLQTTSSTTQEEQIQALQQTITELEAQLDSVTSQLLFSVYKTPTYDNDCGKLSVASVKASNVNGLFRYYTGFECNEFDNLCHFLNVPQHTEEQIAPLTFRKCIKAQKTIPLEDQLVLVLCKLRNNFDTKDLGYRLGISQKTDCCTLFNEWINYIFYRLGEISMWPHRKHYSKCNASKFQTHLSEHNSHYWLHNRD